MKIMDELKHSLKYKNWMNIWEKIHHLYVVTYDIGILPLTKRLKVVYPGVTHSWYSDNTGALGTYNNNDIYFNLINYLARLWVLPQSLKRHYNFAPGSSQTRKAIWLASWVLGLLWCALSWKFYQGG